MKSRTVKAMNCMIFGVVVNAVLFVAKLWVGLASGSISILTDAVNNLGDTATCALSLICFYLIQKKSHSDTLSYGYGRLEPISSFIMSLVITVVGGAFFVSALNRIMLASLLSFKWSYFIVMLVSVFIKTAMACFYKVKNRKIKSDVLRCAFYDSILDASVTFMTVIGLLLTKYVQLRIDAFFGIAVSVLMTVGGIKLCIDSLKQLLGKKLKKETQADILTLCKKCPVMQQIDGIEYHDYGESLQEIIINAVFTKTYSYDTIVQHIKELTAVLEKKTGCTVKFTIDVR